MKAVVTDPASVLTLDLYKCTTADLAYSVPFDLNARRDDFVHALVAWFDIEFTACHKTVAFSTGPGPLATASSTTSESTTGARRRSTSAVFRAAIENSQVRRLDR